MASKRIAWSTSGKTGVIITQKMLPGRLLKCDKSLIIAGLDNFEHGISHTFMISSGYWFKMYPHSEETRKMLIFKEIVDG